MGFNVVSCFVTDPYFPPTVHEPSMLSSAHTHILCKLACTVYTLKHTQALSQWSQGTIINWVCNLKNTNQVQSRKMWQCGAYSSQQAN